MGMQNNERAPNINEISIGSQGAAANGIIPGIYFRKHSRIKNVLLINHAGVAVNAGNHVTAILQTTGGTSYASVDSANVAIVDLVPLPMTLTTPDVVVESAGPAADRETDVPAGTMLNVAWATLGTAVLTLAKVQIEWYPL